MRTGPPAAVVGLAMFTLLGGCHTGSEVPAKLAAGTDSAGANAQAPGFPTNPAALPNQATPADGMRPATMPTATPARVTTPTVPAPSPAPATTPGATVLKTAPASIDLVLAGKKTSTTRKGTRTYPLGPAVLSDGKRQVRVAITSIDPKHLADLTTADAASDGSASLAEYRAALVRSYPGLGDDDMVSVVHFRLAE